jgi:hypothetical protein
MEKSIQPCIRPSIHSMMIQCIKQSAGDIRKTETLKKKAGLKSHRGKEIEAERLICLKQ